MRSSDDRITRETLSNNNPCPSSPSSTILHMAHSTARLATLTKYIYIYIFFNEHIYILINRNVNAIIIYYKLSQDTHTHTHAHTHTRTHTHAHTHTRTITYLHNFILESFLIRNNRNTRMCLYLQAMKLFLFKLLSLDLNGGKSIYGDMCLPW